MYAPGRVNYPSHLLYSDDVLIFARATVTNILRLVRLFDEYNLLSGQYVNWHKLEIIFGHHIPNNRIASLYASASFKKGSLPFHYMGILLFI